MRPRHKHTFGLKLMTSLGLLRCRRDGLRRRRRAVCEWLLVNASLPGKRTEAAASEGVSTRVQPQRRGLQTHLRHELSNRVL